MGLRINDVDMAEINLGDFTSPCCPEWIYLCSAWNSGSATQVEIRIESRTDIGFTDLGIDDVYFGTTYPDMDGILGDDISTCVNDEVVLHADIENASFHWNDGSTADSLVADSPGIYWVEIVGGECAGRDSITIDFNSSAETFMLGNDTTICENTDLVLSPGQGIAADYTWQDGTHSTTYTVDETGWYSFVFDGNCFDSNDSIYVEVTPLPLVDIGDDFTTCSTAQITIVPDVQNEDELLWSNNSTNSTLLINNVGTYWLRVTNECGSATDTLHITTGIFAPIAIHLMNDTTLCSPADITIHANQISGGLQPYTYQWTFNDEIVSTQASFNLNQQISGTYCLKVEDACQTEPENACVDVTIQNAVPVTIVADTTSGCSPLHSTISLTTPEDQYTQVFWTIGDTSHYNSVDEIYHSIIEPGSYDVSVTLTNQFGCSYSETYLNYLNVFANPEAGWTCSPQPTTVENTNIQFVNESIGSELNCHWTFDVEGAQEESDEINPSYHFPQNAGGEYRVRLQVVDENSCTDMIDGVVVIDEIFSLYIPNAVTPDADGTNDVVFVKGIDIKPATFEWRIFNRWGDLIYFSNDPEKPWTCGRQDAEYYVPDGVYTYLVKATALTTGNAELITGFITVIR